MHLFRAIFSLLIMSSLKNKIIRFIKNYLPPKLTTQDMSFILFFLVIFFGFIMPAIYFSEIFFNYK